MLSSAPPPPPFRVPPRPAARRLLCDAAVDVPAALRWRGGPSVLQCRRDGGGDAVECTAAAVSLPPFQLGRSSLPCAPRHAGSTLRWRFLFPASEGAPRRPDVAASAAGWLLSLAAPPRRRRPKRRSQPVTAPVAPNESVVLFIRVRGGLGRGVVGWFGGGAERWSVFTRERRIPW